MSSMIFPRLISIFLLLIVPSFGMIQVSGQRHDKLLFDNLSVKDGLSQLSVLAIFKDSEGYMWFGTRNGLNRYNGYVFDRFLYDQDDSLSISDNYIKNTLTQKHPTYSVGCCVLSKSLIFSYIS